MAKDLLSSIRELAHRNTQRSAGASGMELNSVADVEWLQEFERSVCREIRRRADNVVGRFSDHLQALEREARRPDPRLEATQEIEYREKVDATDSGTAAVGNHGEVLELVTMLSEKVDALQSSMATSSATSDADEVIAQRNLEELADSTSQSIKEGLAGLSKSLDEKLATIGSAPGADATSETDASVVAKLTSIQASIEGLSSGTDGGAGELTTQITTLQQSLEERISTLILEVKSSSGGSSESNGGDATSQLQGLRSDFSLLVHTINNHLEENAQFAEEFTQLRKELLSGAGVHAPSDALSTTEDGTDLRSTITAAVAEVINGHADAHKKQLEESLEKFVGELKTTITSCSPDPESLQRLEGVMESLDPMRALPDKIGAILEAADESQQLSLNAAIQDAIDVIVNRLEEMFQRIK